MEPGTHSGHYEILSALGKGGMGEVYHARDTRLARRLRRIALMFAAGCSSWVLIAATLLSVSGCVSHRYIVSQPDRVLSNWEMIESTRPGTEVELLFEDGSTIQGRYQNSTQNEINILVETGTERSIAKQEIREIRATAADGLAEGIVIGVGLGAAGGAVVKGSGGGNEVTFSPETTSI